MYMRGSYTVEAAVIIPLILLLILAFLFWNFELWEQVILCCETYTEWKTYAEPEFLLRFLKRAEDLLGMMGG